MPYIIVPIWDLTENFDFKKDIHRVSSFPSWPDSELQTDTLVILAYSLAKYKVSGRPYEDVRFNATRFGVLGVVDNS